MESRSDYRGYSIIVESVEETAGLTWSGAFHFWKDGASTPYAGAPLEDLFGSPEEAEENALQAARLAIDNLVE